MNDAERRRYEMLIRANQFGTDNTGDFPSGVGATQFGVISTSVNDVESKSASQQSGFAEGVSPRARVEVTKEEIN